MTAFPPVTGIPARLPLDNIDTDQLIPARFMSTPRAEGYGRFLLHDMKADTPAANLPEGAQVLIAGRNFGSGSSREAAVYALVDFGIRAVLAPSFGDIFAGNAVNNGLLPARVAPEALAQITGEVIVDLDTCTIRHSGGETPFEIDPVWREKLLNGWDDIDLTASRKAEIAAWRARRGTDAPWSLPATPQE